MQLQETIQQQDIWLQWEQINQQGDLYTPRTGHTIALHQNQIYLFSGIDENDRQNDLYSFDIKKQTWIKIKASGEVPSQRSGSNFIQHEDKLYVFGGYTRKNGDYFNDLYLFQTETNTWKFIPTKNTPQPRIDYVICKQQNYVYLFGGSNGYKRISDLNRLDLQTMQWKNINTQGFPEPRFGHSGVIYKNCIYIFGGWNGQKTLNDLWKYDIDTNQWDIVEQSCTIGSRYRHCAVIYDDSMFVFGGVDCKQARYGDLHQYNFQTKLWKMILLGQEGPSARSFHRSIVYENQLFIMGGFDGLRRNDMFSINLDFIKIQNETNKLKTFSNKYLQENMLPLISQEQSQKEHRDLLIAIKKYQQGGYELDSAEQFEENNNSIIQIFNQLPRLRWFSVDIQGNEIFSPRTGHAMVCIRDQIYIFGGIDTEGKRNNDLYKYSITDNKMVQIQLLKSNSQIQKIPKERSGAKCVVMKNDQNQKLIIFFGGYMNKDQEHCNDLFTFNTITHEWDKIIPDKQSEQIEKRTDHSMVKFSKNIYVFGGRGENKSFCRDFMRFSWKKKIWQQLQIEGETIIGRFGHIAVVYKDNMYIFGGWDGQNCLDDLYQYSFTSNVCYEIRNQTGQKPSKRYRHEAIVFKDYLYIMGGVNSLQQRFNDLHQYNFHLNQWNQIITSGCIPSPRTFHKFVNYQNILYIFGGYDGERKNDVYLMVLDNEIDDDTMSVVSNQTTKDNISILSSLQKNGGQNSGNGKIIYMLNEQVKELSRKLQKQEESQLCIICLKQQRNAVFLECAHQALCYSCATNNLKQCPICRQQIERVIKVYAP